ncbi:hypothetical protein VitviT2T_003586 [Vitis vinifera]|uniref:Basic secretory protease n=1 Tax=Vitis vinifera TaxID=29760 RepID=A0ABY9BMN7_VITVI|nr:hypothetical protein VitviT2T_003586 [Vitis vinifera]
MAYNHMFLLSSLVVLAALHGIHAVEYVVTNNAENSTGGVRFNNDIGIEYSRQTLVSATEFIWRLFQQNTPADRKDVQRVTLIIENTDGIAYAENDEIHVNANYIKEYSGDLKGEFTGVLYHEMTHIWQWNGNGQTPGGLIEGIADFVRLKANYIPSHWVQPGQGDRWDQGYDVTARFLDYCNSLRNGFVAELNKKMRSGYSADFFVELLRNNVDQLWTDYKAKETLTSATDFIWRIFQRNTEADRKDMQKMTLIIENGNSIAFTSLNNEIHVNANYLGSYSEGIADFVRLRADLAPSHWVQPGQGDRWDQGYDVTARFLDYCNSLRNGLVAELDQKMRRGYSADLFVELLGKTVDQLWSDYKAQYGN